MKILEYKYKDSGDPGWDFQKLYLNKINLLVGQSAVGKTRILNTFSNMRKFITGDRQAKNGEWLIKFEINDILYSWSFKINQEIVANEKLIVTPNNTDKILINRNQKQFIYNGKNLPKLDVNQLSLQLLKNEDDIIPLYEGFSKIYRRDFWGQELEKQARISEYSENIKNMLATNPLSISEQPVSIRLLYMQKYNTAMYELVTGTFMEIFPFIKDIKIIDIREISTGNLPSANPFPVATFKEKTSQNPIPIMELSSGMQKVLLILTDICSAQENSVFLFDEYENSLGENAIDFFPDFIASIPKNNQYIITSHHPYLINTIPISQWHVFHRKGLRVNITNGSKLQDKYGKSKQKAFTQLVNDELFVEGVR